VTPADATPRRVLVAEDDRFLRKAAEARLRQRGYAVVPAADGEEALALARSECPDLILLDLVMPKLHGFEVLRGLKGDAVTAAIPVIVLSNLGQARDVEEALEGGALTYLVKANLSLQDLVAEVDKALGGAG
jgi:CheY-like chemotaxis protein